MTVSITEPGVGVWKTVQQPSAGQGWTATVPVNKQWRVWGGGCQIVTSSTVATRVPGLVATYQGVPIHVHYNVDSTNTAAGPTASQTNFINYHDHSTLLPRTFGGSASSMPFPAGLPQVWLPPETVLQGVFLNLQSGDQLSNIQLLVEERDYHRAGAGFGLMFRTGV